MPLVGFLLLSTSARLARLRLRFRTACICCGFACGSVAFVLPSQSGRLPLLCRRVPSLSARRGLLALRFRLGLVCLGFALLCCGFAFGFALG